MLHGRAQGTTYAIQYYANQNLVRKQEVDSVLAVIDRSMSLYQDSSLISRFNQNDVSAMQLDPHINAVMQRAFAVHKRSGGYFDVTVEPLVRLWGFGSQRVRELPTQKQIDSVLAFVGMNKLTLRKNLLQKQDRRVSIDLNGIAQGYSVDVLASFLASKNVKNYIVELGGEIKTKGNKPGGQPFEIAIERPLNAGNSGFILQLSGESVTTSGNYRKVFDYQGKKIHHHIDPKTGYPLQNNVASVTVIAPHAVDADAYDNVFMALSPKESIKLANKLKGVEVYIIYKEGEAFREIFSKGFSRYIKN